MNSTDALAEAAREMLFDPIPSTDPFPQWATVHEPALARLVIAFAAYDADAALRQAEREVIEAADEWAFPGPSVPGDGYQDARDRADKLKAAVRRLRELEQ